ncbi:MAG: SMP-30/gluconolactonase/LRE family protein [Pseudomonadota bacterium]
MRCLPRLEIVLACLLLAGAAEARIEDCRRLNLVDRTTGAPIVGVEDIRITPDGTRAYLSAYDRRAEPPTEGALVPLELDRLADAPDTLDVDGWRPRPPTPGGFRPHGIALDENEDLLVVNRRIGRPTTIDRLEIVAGGLNEVSSRRLPEVCNPNAVAALAGDALLVSNDRAACTSGALRLETWLGRARGSIHRVIDSRAEPVLSGLAFPNGLAVVERNLWFAETRGRRVTVFAPFGPELARSYAVGFAPDNLTVDAQGRIWVAGPPNLLAYAAFIRGWPFFDRVGSRVAVIEAGAVEQVLDDDGGLVSGATVAAAGGGWLLIGAAYDDAIAYCRLVG